MISFFDKFSRMFYFVCHIISCYFYEEGAVNIGGNGLGGGGGGGGGSNGTSGAGGNGYVILYWTEGY